MTNEESSTKQETDKKNDEAMLKRISEIKELMEKNGEYAALYRLQFRDQETENPEAFSLEIG